MNACAFRMVVMVNIFRARIRSTMFPQIIVIKKLARYGKAEIKPFYVTKRNSMKIKKSIEPGVN